MHYTPTLKQTVSHVINSVCSELHWSTTELARQAEISRQSAHDLRKGTHLPSLQTLLNIANKSNHTIEHFLGTHLSIR